MRHSFTITVLACAAAGCQGSKTPATDTTQTATPAGASAAATPAAATPSAAVKIIAPEEGATTGTNVTVVLGKEGVTIAKADGARAEGVGHYHLFLDTIPSADLVPIPPTTKNVVHIGTGDSTYTFKGLTPGEHQIIAVLGYGDHSPMPAIRDTVKFVVKR